jgi:hypothetical protein
MPNRFFPALSVAAVILFTAAIFRPDMRKRKRVQLNKPERFISKKCDRLDSMLVAYPRLFYG